MELIKENFKSRYLPQKIWFLIILYLTLFLTVCTGEESKSVRTKSPEYGADSFKEDRTKDPSILAENSKYELVVYKAPSCGCCDNWIEIMEGLGYRVTVYNSAKQLRVIKNTLNISPNLQSCHTTLVEGYILEGHIHPDSVARLLKERDKIRGLFLPGMVANSVGMEQPEIKPVRYNILALDFNNKITIYDTFN